MAGAALASGLSRKRALVRVGSGGPHQPADVNALRGSRGGRGAHDRQLEVVAAQLTGGTAVVPRRRLEMEPQGERGARSGTAGADADTRTAASGTIAITSCERPATPPRASSMPARTASRWRRLFSTKSGTTLPGASSRAAQASRPSPFSPMRPASTRSAAISHASLGFGVLAVELMPRSLRHTSVNQKPSCPELQQPK